MLLHAIFASALLAVTTATLPAKPVNVSVYYETRCPDSHNFVLHQLLPTLSRLGGHINLELVPFGNVDVTTSANGTLVYKCQHGPTECWGNRVEACVLEQATNQSIALSFIKCMFTGSNWKDTHARAPSCARDQPTLSWSAIESCADGPQGAKLTEANWHATPKHSFIPWIVINGQSSAAVQKGAIHNLEGFLCQNYLYKFAECKQN